MLRRISSLVQGLNVDPQRFRTITEDAISRSKEAVAAFLALDPSTEYGPTVHALDAIRRPLNGIEGRIKLFAKVHPSAEMRAEARELEQVLAAFWTELSVHRGLYEAVARLENMTPPGEVEEHLVKITLRGFRRAGVNLSEADRERVQELKAEILRIGQEFDRNCIEGGKELVVAGGRAALDGLPEDFFESHPEAADGSITLSTDPGDRVAVLTFANSDQVRRDYYKTVLHRAAPENIGVLDKLLQKRRELAELLGHSHWADYITEDKMAKSASNARSFIERVLDSSKARAEREYEELLEEKRRIDASSDVVYEWERAWLSERVRRQSYDFDAQEARPYFAYDKVRDGILTTCSALYGVDFVRVETEVWHESVECYELVEDGEAIARFYLDMHPRADKFKHAAMFDVTNGIIGGELPEAALVCNFPEPKGDDPALMLSSQVRTFFHEFGHLLHHLFSRQRYESVAGISCEWDFVEVPSQLFEEWAWDYNVLASFAKHYETGEAIPREMLDRMRAAEEYGKGIQTRSQMVFATLSLDFYELDPAKLDPTQHMIEVKTRLLPFPHTEDTYFVASFGHLHGYSAMYYTYMWSLVIAKDFFSRFDGDVMSREVAGQYQDAVLSRGGSRHAEDLVRSFLGRDYGFEAFESWLND